MIPSTLLADVFEALPVASFLVDADAVVLLANQLGRGMIKETPEGLAAEPRRAGTLLRCFNAENEHGGCGRGQACPDCGLRGVVGDAVRTGLQARRHVALTLLSEGGLVAIQGNALAAPLAYAGAQFAVVTLQEITPAGACPVAGAPAKSAEPWP